jgi:hypothetical protein
MAGRFFFLFLKHDPSCFPFFHDEKESLIQETGNVLLFNKRGDWGYEEGKAFHFGSFTSSAPVFSITLNT